MSLFERWLTLWVFLCIVAGVALGQWLPAPFEALGRMELAQVNLPVGLLIWVMIIPALLRIDFGAMGQVRRHWRGIGVTLAVNWLVKPFSMALLAWFFASLPLFVSREHARRRGGAIGAWAADMQVPF